MSNIWLIGCIIAAVFVLVELFWYILEAVHPFEYRQVRFSELQEHFEQFCRRADRKTEMVVTEESTRRQIRLRKYFRLGKPGIDIDLIVCEITEGMTEAKAASARLRSSGIESCFGIKGTRKYHTSLVCSCKGDPEVAMRIAGFVFHEVYSLPLESLFQVKVKGSIRPSDRPNDGLPTWASVQPDYLHPGKPYKHWQVPGGLFYWTGRLLGAIARDIRNTFVPHRGPGDDLTP